ncbi:hypothetical protein EJ06DRAFT_484040 [Trichodelitschia bisporula]|uniref:Rhodopsin domain-containing protein n=1 Tax=Trichodelitschia bisporula TaxID=703511 RepID=A0A6G1HK59_9PEZI|nr:hypothetical protein EJ06DRAFT_484040 [Trichodelitschia bisporula]
MTPDGTPIRLTVIIFLGISWVIVLLRLATRALIVRSLGWDDSTMGIAMVSFTVYCSAVLKTSSVVSHRNYLFFSDIDTAINYLITAEVFYIVTMVTLKISLSIFFLRIMVKPWQRNTVYGAVACSTLFGLAYCLFAIFQCGYPKNAMVFFIRKLNDKCISTAQNLGMGYTHALITTLTDLIFAILPVAMLKSSNMTSREKWTVGLILIMGAVGGIASMIRFKYIPRLTSASLEFFADATDIAVWSTIEPGLGIIAGCLATLRPLYRTFLRKMTTTAADERQREMYGSEKGPSQSSKHQPLRSHYESTEMVPTKSRSSSLRNGSPRNGYPRPESDEWPPIPEFPIPPRSKARDLPRGQKPVTVVTEDERREGLP